MEERIAFHRRQWRGLFESGMAFMSEAGDCRFLLVRQWDLRDLPPGRWAIWVMLNPSDADEEKNDPTMRRVVHFSKAWGCGGALVINLFSLISPDPSALSLWLRDNGSDAQRLIRQHADGLAGPIREIVGDGQPKPMIVVAWGAHAAAGDWHEEFLFRALGIVPGASLFCLGTNQDGSPRHPLSRGAGRVPDNQTPIRWPCPTIRR